MLKKESDSASNGAPSLNRRQMLRYVAAASVAAAMTNRSKARAEIPARKLKFGSADSDGIRCKRAITLLRQQDTRDGSPGRGMTIDQWLYQPLLGNLDHFIVNAFNYHSGRLGGIHRIDMADLEDRLIALRDAIAASAGGTPDVRGLTLKDYYGFAWPYSVSVVPATVTLAFDSVAQVCASPHVALRNDFRANAVALLDYHFFKTKLANVESNDMYQVDRNTHLNAHVDSGPYMLARMGFIRGVFTEIPDRAGITANLIPNNKCWSESAGACQTGHSGKYCDWEGNPPVPTSASDVCP